MGLMGLSITDYAIEVVLYRAALYPMRTELASTARAFSHIFLNKV